MQTRLGESELESVLRYLWKSRSRGELVKRAPSKLLLLIGASLRRELRRRDT